MQPETEGVSPNLPPMDRMDHPGEGGVPGAGPAGGGGARPVGVGELSHKGGPVFEHLEGLLAEVTGVPQKNLARARTRSLHEGQDWAMRGREVAYSATGLRAVLEKIAGPARDGSVAGVAIGELEARTRIQPEPDLEIKAWVRRLYTNRFLIQVQLDGGRLVNVRVPESKNFRKGMELAVVWNGRVYELRGRAPRFPGRW